MSEDSAPQRAPRGALLHPASAAGLLLLLPVFGAVRWRADIVVLSVLWLAFCRIWTERWFGLGRPDGVVPSRPTRLQGAIAGLLASLLGAVAIAFLRAWDGVLALALLPFVVLAADSAAQRLGGSVRRVLGAVPLLTVLVWAAVTVAGYQSFALRLGEPRVTDDFLYLLRASEPPPALSAAERENAVAIVRATLQGQSPPGPVGRVGQVHPHRSWVTLLRRTKKDRWARGFAEPGVLAEQLVQATRAASQPRPPRDLAGAVIQIDLEGPPQSLGAAWFRRGLEAALDRVTPAGVPFRFAAYDDEAGVDGFRVQDGDREATVLPADPLLDGWYTPRQGKTRFRAHNWLRVKEQLVRDAGLQDAEPWPRGAALVNFRTYSFAQPDPQQDRTVELYRGNTLFSGALDEARLLAGIEAAAGWLLRTVQPDGRFDYEYFPARDQHGRGYNEVRHAGSVYGLFHVANLAAREPALAPQRDAYIEAGARALGRVYEQLAPPPGVRAEEGYVAFLEGRDGSRTSSGAQALTLLSFLERPPPDSVQDAALAARLSRPGDEALLRGLAQTLMAMVDSRGQVFARWTEARAGGDVESQPLYYPGELMLALVRYHEHSGDPRALEVAQKVGRAQIAYARRPFEIPDHWVMQALDHLDALDPGDPTWRDAAYAMGREYVSEQFPPQVPHAPDYEGAYRRDMEIARTTRAASRGEAIGGVARIAWRRGDPSAAWERSLLAGARHLLEQQVTPDNAYAYPNPAPALGAIRMGLIDNHCRIDNNQHALVALDNALAALRVRGDR